MLGALIGAGVQMYGQYKAGQDVAKAEKGKKKVSKEAYAAEKAYLDWKKGIDIQRNRQNAKQLIGMQRVAFAKSGVQVDTGTALNVVMSSALQASQDEAILLQEYKHNLAKAKAGIYKSDSGRGARLSTAINMGSTLLTTGSDLGWWS